jgi:CheY-like chemotaxis protein
MRVLVVDNDLDTLDLFSTFLNLWGHEVRTLQDPTRALSVALEFLPDIAFLDLGMPEVDGWEVAGQMRQNKVLDSTFLVAVTGYSRDEDRARSQAAGFDVHLLKPVDAAHLELLLKRRLHPAPRPRRVSASS